MRHSIMAAPVARRPLRCAAVALALATAIVPLWAVAADKVESLGFDPEQLRQSLFGAMRGWYGLPDVPEAVRALPADQKVAAVQTLGAFAKAYFGSADFKKDYVSAYKQSKPRGFGLPSLDPKALARKAVEKAAGKDKPAPSTSLDKDPKAQLRGRLTAFLAATDGVDYAAITHASGGVKIFDNDEYEAKPKEWKMCYRAGKETAEALRAFARDWLEELK